MGVTQARNIESQARNADGYYIDFELFDEAMNGQKIYTATARARKAGVGRTTYYRVINHECASTLQTAMQFAKAAKMSVNRLFPKGGGNGNPTPPPPTGPSSPTPPAGPPKAGE